jgi:hypothetical protein
MITDLASSSLKHTFLLEEGVWMMVGEVIDEDNRIIPIRGWMRVHHQVDHWYLARDFSRNGSQDKHLISHLRVQPGRISVGSVLQWLGKDTSVGEVVGHFVLMDDAILSQFFSVDGQHRGSETIQRKDPAWYQARGMIMDGGRKVSAWRLDLTRAEEIEEC